MFYLLVTCMDFFYIFMMIDTTINKYNKNNKKMFEIQI